jgi:hypothetical protein
MTGVFPKVPQFGKEKSPGLAGRGFLKLAFLKL